MLIAVMQASLFLLDDIDSFVRICIVTVGALSLALMLTTITAKAVVFANAAAVLQGV